MDKSTILRRCASVVPQLMRQVGMQADSCVLQSRVVIEALSYFKIQAIPIPCTLEVYNTALAVRIKSDNPPRSTAELSDGEWSIGIGFGQDRPGYWGGHLIVGEVDEWVMDISIEQANRLQHGIVLSPLLANYPENFLNGDTFLITNNGCLLRYTVQIGNTRFQRGDWWNKRKWNEFVGPTIRAIKGGTLTTELAFSSRIW